MTQTQAKPESLVKLRVIAKRMLEIHDRNGRRKVMTVDWTSNQVIYDRKKYGPGDEFLAPQKIAESLLESGGVQLASQKPKVFRPISIDHKIQLSDGIKLKEEVEGKIPTRSSETEKNAPWVEATPEDEEDDDDY